MQRIVYIIFVTHEMSAGKKNGLPAKAQSEKKNSTRAQLAIDDDKNEQKEKQFTFNKWQ